MLVAWLLALARLPRCFGTLYSHFPSGLLLLLLLRLRFGVYLSVKTLMFMFGSYDMSSVCSSISDDQALHILLGK